MPRQFCGHVHALEAVRAMLVVSSVQVVFVDSAGTHTLSPRVRPSICSTTPTCCRLCTLAVSPCVMCVYDACIAAFLTQPSAIVSCWPADIQPGQGLYYSTLTSSWRVINCNSSSYGVANRTYGLTPAPCKECPQGMVASRNASYLNSARHYVSNGDGTGGYVSVEACVTQPGAWQSCSSGLAALTFTESKMAAAHLWLPSG